MQLLHLHAMHIINYKDKERQSNNMTSSIVAKYSYDIIIIIKPFSLTRQAVLNSYSHTIVIDICSHLFD
jgi:hypothetical protein